MLNALVCLLWRRMRPTGQDRPLTRRETRQIDRALSWRRYERELAHILDRDGGDA